MCPKLDIAVVDADSKGVREMASFANMCALMVWKRVYLAGFATNVVARLNSLKKKPAAVGFDQSFDLVGDPPVQNGVIEYSCIFSG